MVMTDTPPHKGPEGIMHALSRLACLHACSHFSVMTLKPIRQLTDMWRTAQLISSLACFLLIRCEANSSDCQMRKLKTVIDNY